MSELVEELWDDLKEEKMPTPVIPYYKAGGNVVIEQWFENFTDRAGNTAIVTMVRYKNPKKTTVNEACIQVKWTSLFRYLDK